MRKISLIALLVIFLAVPAVGGDPVDSNDGPSVYIAELDVQAECARAEKYIHCSWCWTNCMLAIMAEAWGDGWDFEGF